MSQIIFGPITSRRFGQSLGIDLSPDTKQCNFDCLYCELKGAKTVNASTTFPSIEDVKKALEEALEKHKNIDVITLTANGEPTLYPHLEALIDAILPLKQNKKLLILSNGSTIADLSIQQALLKLDIVKLSLDCVSPTCFKKLDRPHKDVHITSIIEGMKTFRAKFKKELVIEILVVETLNDSLEEFQALNTTLQSIQPDRIDISTIDRPPAYAVKGVSIERLLELASVIENLHVNIAYKKNYVPEKRSFSEEEILELLKRRPQSSEDVRLCFDEESIQRLETLQRNHNVFTKSIAGVDFYKVNEDV